MIFICFNINIVFLVRKLLCESVCPTLTFASTHSRHNIFLPYIVETNGLKFFMKKVFLCYICLRLTLFSESVSQSVSQLPLWHFGVYLFVWLSFIIFFCLPDFFCLSVSFPIFLLLSSYTQFVFVFPCIVFVNNKHKC